MAGRAARFPVANDLGRAGCVRIGVGRRGEDGVEGVTALEEWKQVVA